MRQSLTSGQHFRNRGSVGTTERRKRERARRRERIVDAAQDVFFSKGPAVATMDDVASRAELSKGTLYLYFGSRDELYLAIGTRALQMLQTRLEEGSGEAGSGLERLRRLAATHRRFAVEHPDHFQTLVAWMSSGFHADAASPSYAQYQQAARDVLQLALDAIETGKRDGSLRADLDATSLALHFWGGSMGVQMLYSARDEVSRRLPVPANLESLVATFHELLFGAIASRDGVGETTPRSTVKEHDPCGGGS